MNSERNVRYAKCSRSANKNPIANILSRSDCVSYFAGLRCLDSPFFANRRKRKKHRNRLIYGALPDFAFRLGGETGIRTPDTL